MRRKIDHDYDYERVHEREREKCLRDGFYERVFSDREDAGAALGSVRSTAARGSGDSSRGAL